MFLFSFLFQSVLVCTDFFGLYSPNQYFLLEDFHTLWYDLIGNSCDLFHNLALDDAQQKKFPVFHKK